MTKRQIIGSLGHEVQRRLIAKRNKGTFRSDGNVLYHGDGYTGIMYVNFMFIVHKLHYPMKLVVYTV